MSHQVRGAGFILIFILVISMAQPGLCFYWNWKFHVHLLNRLSSNAHPLMVHVRSGDNDLGEHAVWRNGDFQFHFKLNFWETTLFYCDFTYGNKHKSCDDQQYVKMHDWYNGYYAIRI
ncbi:Plant self-incompatibility S1 - like 10 [Theobroma cacao]|nr:Plant self-incompatibility S1 - like 10 [Theobroma cacao]